MDVLISTGICKLENMTGLVDRVRVWVGYSLDVRVRDVWGIVIFVIDVMIKRLKHLCFDWRLGLKVRVNLLTLHFDVSAQALARQLEI